jgi:hypothetical protein
MKINDTLLQFVTDRDPFQNKFILETERCK